MKILLLDCDKKRPNLALMKISAYYKALGCETGLDIPDPDMVFASVVFDKNVHRVTDLEKRYIHAKVDIGGPAWDIHKKLSDEIEFLKPDYDLYPSTYSMGYTTRGCIRNCPWCIVPEKEGKIQRWQHIREFHDPRFDTVICLDNNIYADRDWFFENTDYILDNRLKFNAIQGMDIRLLTPEIAERLKKIRWTGQYYFAFDTMGEEEDVRTGIQMLKDARINTKHDVTFYVLVGFNTTPEEDKYRCRLLKELRTNAFVMQYGERTEHTRKLAWWANNRKKIFWICDVEEVDRSTFTGKRYKA
jgi:hypothetical protein